ncbi:MAG TPA: hypothetical protein VI958_08085, partial [Acidobacteriota bacterium]
LMLRWRNESTPTEPNLHFGHFRMIDFAAKELKDGLTTHLFFQGSTKHLSQLQCHGSHLAPRCGYPSHADAYDVAIIVMEGEVETLGQQVGPHGVIFYTAGQPHSMHNPGQKASNYLVFEFHGCSYPPRSSVKRTRSLLSKLADPHCWIRKARHILRRM